MTDRLRNLTLLPPPSDTAWTGAPADPFPLEITRGEKPALQLACPLFWYDPPWHRVAREIADRLAVDIAERGVTVAALRSDLSLPDEEPDFHAASTADRMQPLPRIVPYRPERYGFCQHDFDGATIMDVRLCLQRDPQGRFAYSAEQIERWEATPEDKPLAGGSWVPAASFPPDVQSMQRLAGKLDQLRDLAPQAATFISIGPYRLAQELPAIVDAKPDGVVIRCDQCDLSGLQLTSLVRTARNMVGGCGVPRLPLWIVPGPISPEDVAKLIALGASGVAIDDWCQAMIEQLDPSQSDSPRFSPRVGPTQAQLQELVDEYLDTAMDHVRGLLHSTTYAAGDQRIGSFDPHWASVLGVPCLMSSQRSEG